MKEIICGVPQGSVLGSLLFIIYVNGIKSGSDELEFILFADDTTSLFSHKHYIKPDKVGKELDEICK